MNGFKLVKTVYRPEQEIKACVFIVHGMQEHQRRYKAFAEELAENGIAVVTYDLPGHGETGKGEDRGWFGAENGWDALVSSARDIAVYARNEFPDVPLIYFGHSMGTMIGRCFLQNYDGLIDGMILSGAPVYQKAASMGKTIAKMTARTAGKKGHSAMLDNLATGSFNKAIEDPRTPLDWLSYNEESVDRYIADEDCGFPFTVQGYYDLFSGMVQMARKELFRVSRPDLPIYFFAGEDDPCIGGKKGFDSSVSLLKKVGYRNITTKLYKNMRHETLQEKNAGAVIRDVIEWIEKDVLRI